ncbi:Flagella basal body P-ring formation protein FlgA precursor [compost metagenome]
MPDLHRPRPQKRLQLRRLPRACLLALLLPGLASAEDPTAERVRDFLLAQLGADSAQARIEVIQPTATLAPCTDPQPFLPQSNQRLLGRVAVGLRCSGQGEQTRYLQALIRIASEYLVAARPIAAGEVLTADMLARRSGDLDRLPRNVLTDPAQAIGLQASRPLAEGDSLQSNALRAPQLIERNARVTVEARGRGFSVSRDGVALDNGSLGSEIRVRTDDGEILRARVSGPNRLEIRF